MMDGRKDVWIIESPVTMIEGEQIAYSVDWLGAASVSDPEMIVYRNGADISEEVVEASDEFVVSGRVLTLKKIRARETDGGSNYVALVEATVNGNKERRKLLIQVVRAESEA